MDDLVLKVNIELNPEAIKTIGDLVASKIIQESLGGKKDKESVPEYYTVNQVSEILKIKRDAIQRYCRIGYFESSKVGKSYRIPIEFVEDYKKKIKFTKKVENENR